jgi:hypothetical protein
MGVRFKKAGQTAFASNRKKVVSELPIIRRGNANGQEIKIDLKEYVKATVSGTATETITAAIKKGWIVFGITARVTKVLTGASLSTWSIGFTGTAGPTAATDYFATALAKTLGITSDSGESQKSGFRFVSIFTADTDIIFTAAAGVFSTGEVRLTVHYVDLTPAVR